MATNSISGSLSTAMTGFTEQLWLIVPIGLGVFAIVWGVPRGVRFLKSLAK
jgi:hypothetical protein